MKIHLWSLKNSDGYPVSHEQLHNFCEELRFSWNEGDWAQLVKANMEVSLETFEVDPSGLSLVFTDIDLEEIRGKIQEAIDKVVTEYIIKLEVGRTGLVHGS